VDLAEPRRGLGRLHLGDAPLAGWLLGVTAQGDFAAGVSGKFPGDACTPSDAYVRGEDLIVAYGAAAQLPFALQIYWRAAPLPGRRGALLEAFVSIQTRAWQAFPKVSMESALQVDVADLKDEAAVLRPIGCPWSYAEVAKPGDFKRGPFVMGNNDLGRTAWTFGSEFMERGVIRRLQIRGAVVPRDEDATIVDYLHQSLLAEAPPLTA